jgi:large subunit ribosomal protein L5
MVPRLKEKYEKEIVQKLREEFKYSNIMQVPRIKKVVLNVGLGEAMQNAALLEASQKEIAAITGQKPVVTKARRSIATFKLREGMSIGCMVTLRRDRMWEFLDRLLNLALPRVRDFRGVAKKGFDGNGNFTLGIKEQIIFPEIEYDKVQKLKGMNISIVTSAKKDDEALALLTHLGMPFKK